MEPTEILIEISALGSVTNGLVQGLENLEIKGWVEITQTTALLRLARILRWFLEIWGDFLSVNSSEKPSANAGVKNSKNKKEQ